MKCSEKLLKFKVLSTFMKNFLMSTSQDSFEIVGCQKDVVVGNHCLQVFYD